VFRVVLERHLCLTDSTNGYIAVSNSPVLIASKRCHTTLFKVLLGTIHKLGAAILSTFLPHAWPTTMWEVTSQDSSSGSQNMCNILAFAYINMLFVLHVLQVYCTAAYCNIATYVSVYFYSCITSTVVYQRDLSVMTYLDVWKLTVRIYVNLKFCFAAATDV